MDSSIFQQYKRGHTKEIRKMKNRGEESEKRNGTPKSDNLNICKYKTFPIPPTKCKE